MLGDLWFYDLEITQNDLMPYPRMSYGFSLILQLNKHFYSPISDSCILCEQQVERAVFEIILEQIAEVQKVGRNVMTS